MTAADIVAATRAPSVCPVLGRFAAAAQYRNDTFRTWLAANLERLAGTSSTPLVEIRRAFVLLDSSVREQWPVVIDAIAEQLDKAKQQDHGDKLRGHATALRALPELAYKSLPPGTKVTFTAVLGEDVPDGDLFAPWGDEEEDKDDALEAAADLTAGKFRYLSWTAKASNVPKHWGVWWKVEGPDGARALALDLARARARALARALAAPLGQFAIAAFERALTITEASAPAEEVGGRAATDEAGRDLGGEG